MTEVLSETRNAKQKMINEINQFFSKISWHSLSIKSAACILFIVDNIAILVNEYSLGNLKSEEANERVLFVSIDLAES